MPQAAKPFKNKPKKDNSFAPCRKYHNLYNSSQWIKIRLSWLRKNPLCVECLKEGKSVLATIVDHVIAHKGDINTFYDVTNLQSLCKEHHDKKTYEECRAQW